MCMKVYKELNASLNFHHCFLSLTSTFLQKISFSTSTQTEYLFKLLQGVMLLTKEPVAGLRQPQQDNSRLSLEQKFILIEIKQHLPEFKRKQDNSATLVSLDGPVCATYSLEIMVMQEALWDHCLLTKTETSQPTANITLNAPTSFQPYF